MKIIGGSPKNKLCIYMHQRLATDRFGWLFNCWTKPKPKRSTRSAGSLHSSECVKLCICAPMFVCLCVRVWIRLMCIRFKSHQIRVDETLNKIWFENSLHATKCTHSLYIYIIMCACVVYSFFSSSHLFFLFLFWIILLLTMTNCIVDTDDHSYVSFVWLSFSNYKQAIFTQLKLSGRVP